MIASATLDAAANRPACSAHLEPFGYALGRTNTLSGQCRGSPAILTISVARPWPVNPVARATAAKGSGCSPFRLELMRDLVGQSKRICALVEIGQCGTRAAKLQARNSSSQVSLEYAQASASAASVLERDEAHWRERRMEGLRDRCLPTATE